MLSTTEVFKQGDLKAILPNHALLQQARKRDRADASRWLYMRFGEVRDEEIGDTLVQDIMCIMSWQDGCAQCTDQRRCGHSRAVLEICEEYDRDGFRHFVTRARPCAQSVEHAQKHARTVVFLNSGIPAERYDNTFANFSLDGADMALRAAKGTARECVERNKGLILGGPVGCGKTHLAIAMGMEALKNGRKVKFALMPELLEALKSEMLNNQATLLEEAKRCDWLIVDDAGTENVTSWKDERFFMIVDWRYGHKLPTVITTNAVGEEGLQKVLSGDRGERIFSRLMEMTEQAWMIGAPDYRRI